MEEGVEVNSAMGCAGLLQAVSTNGFFNPKMRDVLRRGSPTLKLHFVGSCLAHDQTELAAFCKELIDIALKELEQGQNLNEPHLSEEVFLLLNGTS